MADDDNQIEIRARNMGWVPEEEWDDERAVREGRRKPSKFKTAAEYVAEVEGQLPVLRERNRFLSDQVTGLNSKVTELDTKLGETSKLVQDLHDGAKALGQRAYEKGRAAALAEMRKASEEGDPEKFDKAQAELDRIEAEQKEATTRAAAASAASPPVTEKRPPEDPARRATSAREEALAKVDPETREWVLSNPWFDAKHHLNTAMIHEHGRVKVEFPGKTITEQLNLAKERVIDKYPEEFGLNPNREGKSPVAQPGPGGRRPTGRTFADLPREDQESFKRQQAWMKEKGTDYTEAEFLADYQW